MSHPTSLPVGPASVKADNTFELSIGPEVSDEHRRAAADLEREWATLGPDALRAIRRLVKDAIPGPAPFSATS